MAVVFFGLAMVIAAPGCTPRYPSSSRGFWRTLPGRSTPHTRIIRAGGRCKAAVFKDFDGDGLLDLYLGTSKGGAKEEIQLHGCEVAFFDFDNDGDLDICLAAFGYGEWAHLYRNHTNNDAWLKVRLAGAKPNTSAIGTKIYVYKVGKLNDLKALLGLSVVTGAHGGYGGGPLLQHFGLGDTRRMDIKVVWPNGATTVRKDIANATTLVIPQEGADPAPVPVVP